MRTFLFVASTISAAALAFACSSSTTITGTGDGGTPDGGSSSGSSGSSSGSSGSSGACNTLAQAGASVDLEGVTEAAPTPAGGTIADGTYTLTSAKTYGLPSASTAGTIGKITLEISGTTAQTVVTDANGNVGRATATFAVSGVALTQTTTCTDEDGGTAGGMDTGNFTATATSLSIYNEEEGFTTEEVFTKQ